MNTNPTKTTNRKSRPEKSKPKTFSEAYIDHDAIQKGIYWTTQNTEGISEAEAVRYGLVARPPEVPHVGFREWACASPQAMLKAARVFHEYKPSYFKHPSNKICRVEVLPDGFRFTVFDSYKEACEAHQRDQA